MTLVFRQFLRRFRRVCLEESGLQYLAVSRSLFERSDAGTEDQAQQVSRILEENCVGLRFCERQGAGNFSDATEIVALIGVQWRKHAISFDGHRSEEEHTVGLALSAEYHDAVEQSVGSFLG